ncbi:hypothetical protein FEM33_06965 [Dyadobacter flavalbus]|uniref:Histidine kinase n=1 Tax=Dyadobacter flavalbus TaxID=2579942 RepID=A0A5M8QW03_9BACT|nr:two-component regulator propeller domain-containing protein [Dyadobacter flavalbus]KAA6440339.1 hypothetical protein FEM33_06965 [Dyadobacter flavalbus]
MKRLLSVLLLITGMLEGCKNNPEKITFQSPEPEWVIYNAANSRLPDNQVNAIAIDTKDVKWIGTANGLARLEGTGWTLYNPENSGLPSAVIQALAVEENGAVWAGTNKGLARFDGAKWTVYKTDNSALEANAITSIVHDSKRHITWIGTEKNLAKFDGSKWESLDLADNMIISLAVDKNGAIWAGTFNHFAFIGGISKYDQGKWTVSRLDLKGYPSTFPFALAVDNQNAVLAVLGGTSVKSVVRISDGYWQEVRQPEKASGLKTILLEGDKIWVGGNTLALFGNPGAECLTVPESGSSISAMALDSKGRKWLGTVFGGIAVYQTSLKQ